ncbi:hypothetical protein ACE6H2_016650 [Prunus campanulata]
MALSSLRLRRTLCSLSTLHRSLSATSALSFSHSSSSPLLNGPTSAQSPASHPQSWTLLLHSRTFRSSSLSSARSAPYDNNQNDKMDPNTILFEGCDYNHWLIVMDFPKDNLPPAEEMVRTYEETCAKGLNISVEEAKQKMYACSTSTYKGFQVVMSEEESQKFEGDKYVNGTIYPRPPPVHHGRQQGRYHGRNRNPDPPRYDRQGPTPNQQGNPSYNQQGPMQGRGNYGPSQTYGSPRQGDNRGPLPVNTPGGRDANQPGRDPQRNFPQGDQRNYAPPGPVGFSQDDRNYVPPQTETHGQGLGGFQGQGTAGAYGQDRALELMGKDRALDLIAKDRTLELMGKDRTLELMDKKDQAPELMGKKDRGPELMGKKDRDPELMGKDRAPEHLAKDRALEPLVK